MVRRSPVERFCRWAQVAAVWSGLLVSVVAGGLDFTVTLHEVAAAADQDQVEVQYPFTNATDGVLEIVEFRSGCRACLKAGPKQRVEPGAKSAIDAVFLVGAMGGTQEKSVTVVTKNDAGEFFEQALTIRVAIPTLVTVAPKKLEWSVGGELTAQSIDIKVTWKDAIGVTGATCTRPNFEVGIEELEPGRHYRMHVVPTSLDAPQLGLIRIETDCQIEKYKNHIVFVSVTE